MLRLLYFLLDEARLAAAVVRREYSCSLHSPAWSQIGQSSGWLMSRNSMHALAHSFDRGRVGADLQAAATVVAQAICGRGIQLIFGLPSSPRSGLRSGPSVGSAHFDQAHAAVAGDRELWVIAIVRHVLPASSQASIMFVPLGTVMPDAVDVDGDQVGFWRVRQRLMRNQEARIGGSFQERRVCRSHGAYAVRERLTSPSNVWR